MTVEKENPVRYAKIPPIGFSFYIPSSLKSFQVLLDTEEIYLERECYCSNEEADFMLCSYVESVF